MTRIIVGFDPSRGQAAIAELRNGLGPGVEWRVLNLDQNPQGVQPARPTAEQEEYNEQHSEAHSGQHDESPNLLQRLTGLFGKDDGDAEQAGPRVGSPAAPQSLGPLDLSEEELDYLRHAPARAGTVIVVTAPDAEETTVRTWSVRHGGFSFAPVPFDSSATNSAANSAASSEA